MPSHGAEICPRRPHSLLRVLFPQPRTLRTLFEDGERDATRYMEQKG